jgi:NAD(P)-dependent dehydrogenase (short-subunit alcohol dehydrogenase family)
VFGVLRSAFCLLPSFVADASSSAAVAARVDAVATRFGRIDILVNSGASVGSRVAFELEHASIDAFNAELDVKVLGALRCIQCVAPHMIRRG